MKMVVKKCPNCGKEISLPQNRLRYYSTDYCVDCWYLGHRRYGRHKDSVGYVRLRIYNDNPYFSMARHDGYILEHRLVMAQNLGRLLKRWEIVHHKNHIRDDNRIENLWICSGREHQLIESSLLVFIDKLLKTKHIIFRGGKYYLNL